MKSRHTTVVACALFASLVSGSACAHFMTQPYILPVPFWMYAYGCAATLIVTFGVLGYFTQVASADTRIGVWEIRPTIVWSKVGRWVLSVLRAGSVACLLFTIVATLIGTREATQNAGMLMFWIVLMLGFTYLTALIGDLYELINPWRVIVEWVERLGFDFSRVRIEYPAWLGYYPALLFYVFVIWMELFILPDPRVLGYSLLVYSIINFAAAAVFGKAAWFRFGEMFSVFFRLIGTLAPVEYARTDDGRSCRVGFRAPFVGALKERPEHMGMVLFVLFMLSSTTYDAIHDTEMWLNVYWKHLIVWAQPLWGTNMHKAESGLMYWWLTYKRAGLLLSPIVYFALYMLVIAWTRKLTKTTLSMRTLALDFIVTLVPIAFVYNVAHYYTMLLLEGARLPVVFTDPFGFGWNLFGLERQTPYYVDMGVVWHTQVALILIGHVVSVYLAHRVALRVFPSRRTALVSQIPMLLLMVAYTAIGLYILSLPLALRYLREG